MAPRRLASFKRDPVAIAGFIVLCTLIVTLLAGLLVPIYTDEIAWRMMTARSPLDGGVDRALGDQCGPGTTIRAPIFMQPVRHWSAWFGAHFPDPRAVRITGVACALLWVALFWRLACFLPDHLRAAGRTIGLSLIGLGVLPFLLVWSRPEQPLLIAYTLCVLITLTARSKRAPSGKARAWVSALAIVALGLITLSYHPKSMMFLSIPIFAAALSSSGRGSRLPRILAIGTLILCGVIASNYWGSRLSCQANPALAAKLAQENIAAVIATSPPLASVELLLESALPWRYIKLAAPSADYSYMSDWLPAVPLQPTIGAVWRVASRAPWYAAMIIGLLLLAGGAIAAIVRRSIDPRLALGLTLAATMTAWSASQLNKNSYESALQLPLAAIALILALSSLPRNFRPAATACALALAALTIASQVLLLANYGTALAATAARGGPIEAQPYSYVPWGYPKLREDILVATRSCGLDPVRSRKLLVDDLTYFPLMQSREPLNRMSYFGPWHGTIGDPVAYLRAHGSAGAVLACAYLSPEARSQAKAVGRFCCFGPWTRTAP